MNKIRKVHNVPYPDLPNICKIIDSYKSPRAKGMVCESSQAKHKFNGE